MVAFEAALGVLDGGETEQGEGEGEGESEGEDAGGGGTPAD